MDLKMETLIAQMQDARNCLNSAMDKIDAETQIYPSWQLKQVMDHITGWDELVCATLRLYQQGETPERSVRGMDKFNAASISDRQGLSLEESRKA